MSNISVEWLVEEMTDDEYNDVVDVYHFYSAAECLDWMKRFPLEVGLYYSWGLVRDTDDSRAWAYVDDGKLPEYYEDAYQRKTVKVTKPLIAEFERATK